MDLAFHPIANIFPLLGEDDLLRLRQDIATNGLAQPIVLFEGKILDGRNRYTACKLAGVQPITREFTGTRAEALAYVWSTNVERRHLTSSQIAVAAVYREKLDAEYAAAVEAMRDKAKKRENVGKPSSVQKIVPTEKDTSQLTDHKLAEAAGTNREYLAKARKLAEASPELADEVLNGKKKLSAAIKEAFPKKDEEFAESKESWDVTKMIQELCDDVARLLDKWPEDKQTQASHWIRVVLKRRGL